MFWGLWPIWRPPFRGRFAMVGGGLVCGRQTEGLCPQQMDSCCGELADVWSLVKMTSQSANVTQYLTLNLKKGSNTYLVISLLFPSCAKGNLSVWSSGEKSWKVIQWMEYMTLRKTFYQHLLVVSHLDTRCFCYGVYILLDTQMPELFSGELFYILWIYKFRGWNTFFWLKVNIQHWN